MEAKRTVTLAIREIALSGDETTKALAGETAISAAAARSVCRRQCMEFAFTTTSVGQNLLQVKSTKIFIRSI